MGSCYDWETWCHMNCHISFISRLSMHIHNMKIISEMDNKFFGLKKKFNIHFIDCLRFYKSGYVYCSLYLFCFILQAVSTVLSTTSSGCFACCCLNVSFIHIPLLRPKTLPAVCADLVNPWISRNISAYFWRCDVFWDLREIAYYSCYHTQEQRLFCTSDCWHCQNKAAMEICKLYKI